MIYQAMQKLVTIVDYWLLGFIVLNVFAPFAGVIMLLAAAWERNTSGVFATALLSGLIGTLLFWDDLGRKPWREPAPSDEQPYGDGPGEYDPFA